MGKQSRGVPQVHEQGSGQCGLLSDFGSCRQAAMPLRLSQKPLIWVAHSLRAVMLEQGPGKCLTWRAIQDSINFE